MTDATGSRSDGISQWRDLLAFQPADRLTTELSRRGYLPRPITTGEGGQVNLDDFVVRVTELPKSAGRRLTPAQLLAHVRENLNDFVDDRLAEFRPDVEAVDGRLWRSSRPRGAVVLVALKMWRLADIAPLVCSEATSDHWRFTTLGLIAPGTRGAWRNAHRVRLAERLRRAVGKTQAMILLNGSHPISGTREFGVRRREQGVVEIYTRAADCVTDIGWSVLNRTMGRVFPGEPGASIIYAMGDQLWASFQIRTAQFVNENGGRAFVVPPRVVRPQYEAIRRFAPR